MSESARASRITSYKNAGQGNTELRRKRAELSVALRKQAREDQLLKRRALSPDGEEEQPTPPEKLPSPEEIVKGLKSGDLSVMTSCARAARRVLSREQNPPITSMVRAGVIAPLVAALDRDDCTDLQFEAAWALTNIASGSSEHTMAVVDGGAIPRLVTLASLGGAAGEQSSWALGNIAGDGASCRDRVLHAGALPALLPALRSTTARAARATAVWTVSNLCRNKNPLVDFELVSPALPYLSEILTLDETETLADACWALSYLTDGPNDRIEGVQTTPGLLERLVQLLQHKTVAVKTPALRAVGNMLTGSDVQTDRCLSAGCLPLVASLLRGGKPSLVKEACWALSNVLAGTAPQIQRVIDSGALLLLPQVLREADSKCQKEAAWAVTNLCLGGTPEQLDVILTEDLLPAYGGVLHSADHKAVSVVLDGLTKLLQTADNFGQVEALCIKLEEIGILDKIEALQQHENEDVYRKVVHIMDTYFAEQEDQLAEPAKTNEEYTFGTTQSTNNIQF